MGEGYDLFIPVQKPGIEDKLSKYKNRMDLIRTLIGFAVLSMQLFIVYHLYTSK
jgi:hypothetical protein